MKKPKILLPAIISVLSGFVGGMLAGGHIMLGHPASASGFPKVLEAEEVVVVDKLGKPRVMLSTYACDDAHPGCPNEGMANVLLFDQRGQLRVGLSSGRLNEGPSVILTDLNGERRVVLSLASATGEPGLSLFDPGQKVSAHLGPGLLALQEPNKGAAKVLIGVSEQGPGVMLDSPGNSAASLVANPRWEKIPGQASLQLSDGQGRVVAHLP